MISIKTSTSVYNRWAMVFVPRRRSLYFKVLLLIPASWFLLTLLINLNEKAKQHTNNLPDVDLIVIQQQQQQQSSSISSSLLPILHNPMPIVNISSKGPGELGKPVVLPSNVTSEVQSLISKGWQDNAFNQYVSDMISLRRSLPDVRDPQ